MSTYREVVSEQVMPDGCVRVKVRKRKYGHSSYSSGDGRSAILLGVVATIILAALLFALLAKADLAATRNSSTCPIRATYNAFMGYPVDQLTTQQEVAEEMLPFVLAACAGVIFLSLLAAAFKPRRRNL